MVGLMVTATTTVVMNQSSALEYVFGGARKRFNLDFVQWHTYTPSDAQVDREFDRTRLNGQAQFKCVTPAS